MQKLLGLIFEVRTPFESQRNSWNTAAPFRDHVPIHCARRRRCGPQVVRMRLSLDRVRSFPPTAASDFISHSPFVRKLLSSCLFVGLSSLSVGLSACLSVCPSVCPASCPLPAGLPVQPFLRASAGPPVCLVPRPPVSLSGCLSRSRSLSVHLPFFLFCPSVRSPFCLPSVFRSPFCLPFPPAPSLLCLLCVSLQLPLLAWCTWFVEGRSMHSDTFSEQELPNESSSLTEKQKAAVASQRKLQPDRETKDSA